MQRFSKNLPLLALNKIEDAPASAAWTEAEIQNQRELEKQMKIDNIAKHWKEKEA
jgi:hypothetical protein